MNCSIKDVYNYHQIIGGVLYLSPFIFKMIDVEETILEEDLDRWRDLRDEKGAGLGETLTAAEIKTEIEEDEYKRRNTKHN